MNKMKQKNKEFLISRLPVLFVGFIFILLGLLSVAWWSLAQKQELQVYKTILYADYEFSEVSLDSQKADSYYDEAGYAYENNNYKLIESNCRLARNYYLEESQGYKKIKSLLMSSEVKDKDKLIGMYIDFLDELITATDSKYEACEHFEVAARYYDKYFSMNVPYNFNYEMGGKEIDMMNEKIREHDKAIGRYNQLLEDFRVELERRLK